MQLGLPWLDTEIDGHAASVVPRSRRIYCNRSLRMDQIDVVGFDMDYTLAIYKQQEMDRLSIEVTARKLVERGYPESLLTMEFDAEFPIRGLVIDKKYGHVLKIDRYRHVKKLYHGLRELSFEVARQLYQSKRLRLTAERYHWVDTLYALSEVSIFCAVIQELEGRGARVDYLELFNNIRACIDEAHQDGSILDAVAADLPRYTVRDPRLGSTFHRLRSSGKRIFLLTNSNPGYTEHMMSYLLGGADNGYPSWRHYFDVIIASAKKPFFFITDQKFKELASDGREVDFKHFERGHIYTGGNILDFEQCMKCPSDRILYVGDHIYGDVLRAKKATAWRTAMIIQEMEAELTVIDGCRDELDRLGGLALQREQLVDAIGYRQNHLREVSRRLDEMRRPNTQAADAEHVVVDLKQARYIHRRAIDHTRKRIKALDAEMLELEESIDKAFHPYWGSIFKVGREVSSFGDQVEEYACLYTDRASNISLYSPNHHFRSARHRMAHEP